MFAELDHSSFRCVSSGRDGGARLETAKMPTKKKALIRARREKTGERYATAKRHVERKIGGPSGPPGAFEQLVEHVIILAAARNEEERRLNGGRDGVDLTDPVDIEEILAPPPSAERALRDTLRALPYQVLRKLELVMYAGRGTRDGAGSDIRSIDRLLRRAPIDIVVSDMTSKTPLDRYLRAGIECARSQRLALGALDAEW